MKRKSMGTFWDGNGSVGWDSLFHYLILSLSLSLSVSLSLFLSILPRHPLICDYKHRTFRVQTHIYRRIASRPRLIDISFMRIGVVRLVYLGIFICTAFPRYRLHALRIPSWKSIVDEMCPSWQEYSHQSKTQTYALPYFPVPRSSPWGREKTV